MLPIDPPPLPPPAGVLPAQAMAYGGRFVRPGAVAWGGVRSAPDGAYSSCEAVEQALTAVVKDAGRMGDLVWELARARLWVPLPAGRGPVTDGSAVTLPTVTYLGAEFVPCFTSIQRLAAWPDAADAGETAREPGGTARGPGGTARGPGVVPGQRIGGQTADHPPGEYAFADVERRWQRTGGSRVVPHIVVPAAAIARRLPAGLGIALNPGAEASVPIYPWGVADLTAAGARSSAARTSAARSGSSRSGAPIRVGHPPAEPVALLREVGCALQSLPAVRQAARAWLWVPGRGEGLVISVTLDDPASEPAREAALHTIERAVAAVPRQAQFPIDVTFPGESEPDVIDDWVASNTVPFYTRD